MTQAYKIIINSLFLRCFIKSFGNAILEFFISILEQYKFLAIKDMHSTLFEHYLGYNLSHLLAESIYMKKPTIVRYI